MEVKYTGQGPCAGENGTRALTVTAEPAFWQYTVRLAFASPAGRVYITPPLTLTEGEAEYPLPACLLDAPGTLRAQVVAEGDGGRLAKSEIAYFRVERSIAARAARAPETGGLISLETLHSSLLALDERLDGKSDAGHTHDDRYYDKEEMGFLLEGIELECSSKYVPWSDLATVATTGDYGDLSNTPTIPTVPTISTDIAADAASDLKTASPKAVKTYVDAAVAAGGAEIAGAFVPNFTEGTGSALRVKQVGKTVYLSGLLAVDSGTWADVQSDMGEITGVAAPAALTYIPVTAYDNNLTMKPGYLLIPGGSGPIKVYKGVDGAADAMMINGFYMTN